MLQEGNSIADFLTENILNFRKIAQKILFFFTWFVANANGVVVFNIIHFTLHPLNFLWTTILLIKGLR